MNSRDKIPQEEQQCESPQAEKPCHRQGTHEGWLESEGVEQDDDCHRTRMGSKQRSVQAGLSRDSPSLSWAQSEAIRESQQGSNITTLCHKSITQLPPWRWDWRKAKRNLGDQLGGCEGNRSEQGGGGGKEEEAFSRSIWSFGGHCVFYFTTQMYTCGRKMSSEKAKAQKVETTLPESQLDSLAPIQH